jgi:hypothetical protein
MNDETQVATETKTKSRPKRKSYDVLGEGTIQVRTGEKLERTLRLERIDVDPHGTAPAILLLGVDLVYSGGKTRVAGLVCTMCKAGRIPLTDEPAIMRSGPGSYPDSPPSYQCALCGHSYGKLSGLINAFGGDWRDQLELLRKIGGSTPIEREWVIAEDDGKRAVRPRARAAIDAAVTPNTGSTIKLVKALAFQEDQVLNALHDPDLPLRDTRIDRQGRPRERWNVRPSMAERSELQDAWRDHRRETEATIDAELRALRHEKLAAAGYA